MNRTELEKIYKKHVHGYLEKDRMARFEDIPTWVFIDAMEEALAISGVQGKANNLSAKNVMAIEARLGIDVLTVIMNLAIYST